MDTFLLIDIGNSMVDCYLVYNSRGLFFNFPAKTKEIGETFFLKIGELGPSLDKDLKVFISSVNSKSLESILKILRNHGVLKIKVLDEKIMIHYAAKHGFEITNTSVLAGDLFADIVGGESDGAEIIVDLGTATKVLAVDADKRFLGGMIFPGIYHCSKILADKTDLLKDEPVALPKNIVSLVTSEAINSGAIYGTALMVKGFIEQLEQRYNFRGVTPIVTGGGGGIVVQAFERLGFSNYRYDRLRLLRGLANAFELKEKMRGTDLYETR